MDKRRENRRYMMEQQGNKKLQGDGNGKVWISVILLAAAVICIGMLIFFQEHWNVSWAFALAGLVCMFAAAILYVIEQNRNGKAQSGRQIRAAIGLPVMVYLGIIYFIFEYVVGY